jgi:CheY-like chemotaxis protein
MTDTVLVIEDNAANMKLVTTVLTKSGYNVTSASDAEAGLTLAKTVLPDLILMDIQLPGMDGLTAAGLLKKDPATQRIPIIAVTAFAMKGDREKMLAGGCDAYMTKPISYKELLLTVAQYIQVDNHG